MRDRDVRNVVSGSEKRKPGSETAGDAEVGQSNHQATARLNERVKWVGNKTPQSPSCSLVVGVADAVGLKTVGPQPEHKNRLYQLG